MRKFISLVLCLALTLTLMPTSFADVEKSSGEKLKDFGLVAGNEKGNLLESEELTREDAVLLLLRLLGKDEEAKKPNGKCPFKDVKEGSYYYNQLTYAEKHGIAAGIGNSKFGVGDIVTEKQMLAFTLRSLGYKDTKWDKVVGKANELGLTDGLIVQAKSDMIRAKAFDYMLASLDVKIKGTDKKLGEKLGLKGYENKTDDKKEEEDNGDFRVKEIDSSSLKLINIVFSDKVQRFDVDKLHIKIANVSYKLYLRDDGKTVTAVFTNPLKQGKKINVSIKNFDSENGDTIKDYEKEIVMDDDIAPKLLDAKFLDKKTLKLSFSEPVILGSKTYRKNVAITVDDKNPILKLINNDYNDEFLVIFKNSLKIGTHDVEISHLKDYGKNPIKTQNLELELAKDTEEPEAIKVEPVNNQKILVYFNEPVYKKGVFKIKGTYTKMKTYHNNREDVLELEFEKNIGIAAIEGAELEYRAQEDRSGNKVDDWQSIEFEFPDDTSLPEVDINVNKNNEIRLDFSKSMDTKYGEIELLDKDGDDVLAKTSAPFEFEKDSSDSVLILKFKKKTSGSDSKPNEVVFKHASDYKEFMKGDSKTYQLKLKGFKDATYRANKMITVKEEIKNYDLKYPELVYSSGTRGAKITKSKESSEEDTITFNFSEPMNEDDLNNLDNYRCSDSDFGLFSSIDGAYVDGIYDDEQTVVIVVPHARDIKSSATFKVYGIRDKSGKMMKTAKKVKIMSNRHFYLKSASAVKRDEIVLTFSEEVAEFDADAYEIKENNDEILYISDYDIEENNKKKVRIYLSDKMTSSPSDYLMVPTDEADAIRSKFNETLSRSRKMNISSTFGCYVEKIESKDLKFIVTMSEPVLFEAGNSKSVSENIFIFDEADDDKWMEQDEVYKVKKLDGESSKYVSQFEIVSINPANNEPAFSEGLSYKIKIVAAYTKTGGQSRVYEESVVAED